MCILILYFNYLDFFCYIYIYTCTCNSDCFVTVFIIYCYNQLLVHVLVGVFVMCLLLLSSQCLRACINVYT